MRIWILPTAREWQTLHALKDRGLSITTIRTKRGTLRNVAMDVPMLTSTVQLDTRRKEDK